MNELGLIANKNLRRFGLAQLENTGGDIIELRTLSRRNSQDFHRPLAAVLERLEKIESIQVDTDDPSPPLDEQEETAPAA